MFWQRDNLYSRIILWLRILLPLSALALLSTLFLLSRPSDQPTELPFARQDLEDRAATQQVTAPFFSGTSNAGDLITLTADRARPDPEANGGALADDVALDVQLVGGTAIRFTAPMAQIIEGSSSLSLSGGVTVSTSDGYRITTDGLVSALDKIDARSTGPVTGDGPLGQFQAGAMHVRETGTNEAVEVVFSNGVNLVYVPQR